MMYRVQMNQLLLLTKNNITETMRSYSNWEKEITLYRSSYINSLESTMVKKLQSRPKLNLLHKGITFLKGSQIFFILTRSIYGTFSNKALESKVKLNSNKLQKRNVSFPQKNTHSSNNLVPLTGEMYYR